MRKMQAAIGLFILIIMCINCYAADERIVFDDNTINEILKYDQERREHMFGELLDDEASEFIKEQFPQYYGMVCQMRTPRRTVIYLPYVKCWTEHLPTKDDMSGMVLSLGNRTFAGNTSQYYLVFSDLLSSYGVADIEGIVCDAFAVTTYEDNVTEILTVFHRTIDGDVITKTQFSYNPPIDDGRNGVLVRDMILSMYGMDNLFIKCIEY